MLAIVGLALLVAPSLVRAADGSSLTGNLELRKGDHISLIGNTLADRMQHDGWLETFLHSPLSRSTTWSIRNLGFSGDELTLRLRSADFGTPDEWLTKHKADVIFAFFGYNESFAGEAGSTSSSRTSTPSSSTRSSQKYNGKTAPRLVLFSPIAHENLHDRNLPDGSENNNRLALYTAAMAEVAKAQRACRSSICSSRRQELYAQAAKPLTINGIHLNEHGNRQLAADRSTRPCSATGRPSATPPTLEKLRQAVLDKNFYWFNRYRTVDGYSIYGGRADLQFVDGQTNRVVVQRELEVLDVMTANRDKRIWAVAQGERSARSTTATRRRSSRSRRTSPARGPDGKHLFLDGEEAIKQDDRRPRA